MIVAGVMSGTSADGINVALVRIDASNGGASDMASPAQAGSGKASRSKEEKRPRSAITLLGHAEYRYPSKVRQAVLSAMNSPHARVAELARLNFLLGELYADAVLAIQPRFRVKAELIGCHGQTLYHQGDAQAFLGCKIATTWQTGEGALIAARLGVPVVSDFRPADMAAGGKGAPLVPFLDYMWFRDAQVGRIVQNIGGIANLTAIPAGARTSDVLAFDTGPGNMVIDAVVDTLYSKPFDRGGKIAATGTVIEPILQRILRRQFFRATPPKTAGREEFGREFVQEFLRACGRARKPDIVATATALTARSIADAIQAHVLRTSTSRTRGKNWRPSVRSAFQEIILSGGGARNATLVAMLAELLAPLGIVVRFSDEFGLPSDAKEAVAFAVLAYETWHQRASSVPSATGAKRAAILGKISYA